MKTMIKDLRFFFQPIINSDKYNYRINNTIFKIIIISYDNKIFLSYV